MQLHIQASLNEVSQLRQAVQMLSNPPPPPVFPSINELAAALIPRIMDAVKDDIASALEGQKAEVERIVREKAPDLSQLENGLKQLNKAPEIVAAVESAGWLASGAKGKENNPRP